MGLIRSESQSWDPFRELESLSTRLNRMFGRPATDGGAEWSPTCNIAENDGAYVVSAELPEVKKEDVHVRVDGQTLVLEGERKSQKEDKGTRHHRVESFYGKFVRSFALPDDADPSKIEATTKDGMLTIRIPKLAEKKITAREIAVH